MSFIKVRDQNGNPPSPAGRLDVALTPDGFNSPQDRRFTDNEGNVSFTGCNLVWPDAHGKFTLDVNTANVNPDYLTAHVHTDDIEAAPILITIPKSGQSGNQCPVNFNKQQFTDWFNRIKVGDTVTITAMEVMAGSLKVCGFEWQNMCRSSDEWRPRIHQPPFLNGPCTGSTHDVDCGYFGSAWVLTFRY